MSERSDDSCRSLSVAVKLAAPEHASSAPEEASCSPAIEARREAFLAFAKHVPIPKRVQEAWIADSDFPLASFLLFHGCITLFTLTYGSQFLLGSLHYPSATTQTLCRVFGTLITLCHVTMHALATAYGPKFLQQHRRFMPALVFMSATVIAFALFHVSSREALVPYQSRFAFLVSITLSISSRNVYAMVSYLTKERGPPSTHPAFIVFRGGMKAMRIADCLSDSMVLRTLWESCLLYTSPSPRD